MSGPLKMLKLGGPLDGILLAQAESERLKRKSEDAIEVFVSNTLLAAWIIILNVLIAVCLYFLL